MVRPSKPESLPTTKPNPAFTVRHYFQRLVPIGQPLDLVFLALYVTGSEAAKRHGDIHSIRELEAPEADAPVDDDEELPFGKVVRAKRFAMKPMSVEEAVVQMELVDHALYLFMNDATGDHNVLYRRNDGDYG